MRSECPSRVQELTGPPYASPLTTKKLGVEAEIARRKVELLAKLDVIRIEVAEVLGAIDLQRLHSLSFWGALTVRCAKTAGCSRLLSEAMQHGRLFDGVRIENPFVEAGES